MIYCSPSNQKEASKVICWSDPQSWVNKISLWTKSHIEKDGIEYLISNRESSMDAADDDSYWLELFEEIALYSLEETIDDIKSKLKNTAIRVFHGCRTENAESYMQKGILLKDRKQKLRVLEQFIRRHQLPNTDEIIKQGKEVLDKYGSENNKLFVCLDDRELIATSAHYIIYGSEFLFSALHKHQEKLKSIGTPTIIHINLPLALAHESEKTQLAEALLHEWVRQITLKPSYIANKDFAFALTASLPAEYIVEHTHPESMVDWHNGGETYKSPNTVCEYCK